MPTLIAMRSFLQQSANLLHDIIGGKTEMGEYVRGLAGRTEGVDAEHAARAADITPPALPRASLHREAPRQCAWQHRLAVGLVLRIERLGRGHGDEAHAPAGGVHGI